MYLVVVGYRYHLGGVAFQRVGNNDFHHILIHILLCGLRETLLGIPEAECDVVLCVYDRTAIIGIKMKTGATYRHRVHRQQSNETESVSWRDIGAVEVIIISI